MGKEHQRPDQGALEFQGKGRGLYLEAMRSLGEMWKGFNQGIMESRWHFRKITQPAGRDTGEEMGGRKAVSNEIIANIH